MTNQNPKGSDASLPACFGTVYVKPVIDACDSCSYNFRCCVEAKKRRLNQ